MLHFSKTNVHACRFCGNKNLATHQKIQGSSISIVTRLTKGIEVRFSVDEEIFIFCTVCLGLRRGDHECLKSYLH
jgi:hypothetical protein